MKSGMWVILLGVLGVIIGGAMYAIDWHRTIGTGGIGVGIVLLVVGGYMFMQKAKPAPVAKPAQTTTYP
ncbi:MAG: hypothetical protein OK438_00870 [Thaumarchaeota archaeon]|nr:hypothetical protein [Nitrososphaerota archaeon]